MARRRLDLEMVERGLAASRSQAQSLIEEKCVLVSGSFADKAARMVSPAESIRLLVDGPGFVSRAGNKLCDALEAFGISVDSRICLDVGASTGGFTDCLLQRGAAGVTTVDVGTNQLHEKIRSNSLVTVFEKTDIRKFETDTAFSLIVADLSFISLKLVLPKLWSVAEQGADVVVLIKPQFEAGRAEVSKGSGVVSNVDIWRRVVREVVDCATDIGFEFIDTRKSSVVGTKGNVEFVCWLNKPQ